MLLTGPKALPEGFAPRPGSGAAPAFGIHEEATSIQEVRLRSPDEIESWRNVHAGNPASVELFLDLHRSDPRAAHRLAEAVTAMPEVGSDFLGFRLVAELGRGALGRAYLARQGELADRNVVLKVSPDIQGESQTLAQLQHTNVVPLYSVHRAGPLQAVCMPYFGATTLAHVLKDLQGRNSLPVTGEGLVSTIVDRKSTVRPAPAAGDPVADPTATPDRPAPAPVAAKGTLQQPGVATAVLEMLQRFTHVEAVLWMGARLADGLAHAHERGILHRDIKPANILLTDEGQPMLLDFNLAQDTKLAGSASAAQVGGTLPFMSPEQLEAYQFHTLVVNYNSDVYSLGVILFELLTGRHPFPVHVGQVHDVLGKMIADRLKPAPSPRQFNRAVSPAADAIVRRCLAPLTSDRYRSARDLREDLDRHLDDLPLKHTREPSPRERAAKWLRRHPRLASTSTVAALAVMLLAGVAGALVARDRQATRFEGRQDLAQLEEEGKELQFFLTACLSEADRFRRGMEGAREALRRHGVLENPNWLEARRIRLLSDQERRRFREGAAEMLILLARATSMQARQHEPGSAERAEGLEEALRLNRLAESSLGPDGEVRALWRQRADLCHYLGRPDEERACRERADRIAPNGRTDRFLVATDLIAGGRLRETARWLREVVEGDPSDARAWLLLGICHDGLGQYPEAVADYSTCIALNPTFPWAYYNRGITRLRQQDYRHAAADFDRALLLQADMKEAHLNRAVARQGLGDYAGAAADLTRALELKAPPTHVLFQRAAAREKAGDAEGAKRDREEAFRLDPTDELGFLSRGYARLAQPERALEDFERACKLNPRSLAALQNKAYALSRLGRSKEAAEALDRAIELYPDFVKARAGRGVMLARLGRRTEAHRDADECLARDTQPITHYQLAGVYALTSRTNPEDRARAFHLLRQALGKGVGFDLIESDRDLDPIRNAPEFRELVAAARAIRPVGGQPGPNRK